LNVVNESASEVSTEESAGENDDTSSNQDLTEESEDRMEEASEGDSDSEEDDIIQEGRPWEALGANYLQNSQTSTLER
jgi:hypothetical protein